MWERECSSRINIFLVSILKNMNSWHKAIAQPATEFEQTNLSLLEGKIPAQLQGTLYRNGPARLAIGKQKVGHWFDGDLSLIHI